MKTKALYLLLLFVAIACGKSELINDFDEYTNSDNPEYIIPDHCSNGVFDKQKGEVRVDCGEVCRVECEPYTACSDLNVHYLYFDNVRDTFSYVTISGPTNYNLHYYYVMYNNDSTIRLNIEFEHYYQMIDSTLFLLGDGENDIHMSFSKNSKTYKPKGSNTAMYFGTSGYNSYLEFCDVEFSHGSTEIIKLNGSVFL